MHCLDGLGLDLLWGRKSWLNVIFKWRILSPINVVHSPALSTPSLRSQKHQNKTKNKVLWYWCNAIPFFFVLFFFFCLLIVCSYFCSCDKKNLWAAICGNFATWQNSRSKKNKRVVLCFLDYIFLVVDWEFFLLVQPMRRAELKLLKVIL